MKTCCSNKMNKQKNGYDIRYNEKMFEKKNHVIIKHTDANGLLIA